LGVIKNEKPSGEAIEPSYARRQKNLLSATSNIFLDKYRSAESGMMTAIRFRTSSLPAPLPQTPPRPS